MIDLELFYPQRGMLITPSPYFNALAKTEVSKDEVPVSHFSWMSEKNHLEEGK